MVGVIARNIGYISLTSRLVPIADLIHIDTFRVILPISCLLVTLAFRYSWADYVM